MNIRLSVVECRVLACLMEKAMSTPEYYPLTQAALQAACNQKNNRDPVMQVGTDELSEALESLRAAQLVWQVDAAGARVPKYEHRVAERIQLDRVQMALLAELMLRGPQTAAELRARASRMAPLEDAAVALAALDGMAQLADGPCVVLLPREPGRREARYAHLLCGEVTAGASSAPVAVAPAAASRDERLAALEATVAALQQEVAALRARVEASPAV